MTVSLLEPQSHVDFSYGCRFNMLCGAIKGEQTNIITDYWACLLSTEQTLPPNVMINSTGQLQAYPELQAPYCSRKSTSSAHILKVVVSGVPIF